MHGQTPGSLQIPWGIYKVLPLDRTHGLYTIIPFARTCSFGKSASLLCTGQTMWAQSRIRPSSAMVDRRPRRTGEEGPARGSAALCAPKKGVVFNFSPCAAGGPRYGTFVDRRAGTVLFRLTAYCKAAFLFHKHLKINWNEETNIHANRKMQSLFCPSGASLP